MQIGIPKERLKNEARVAATPKTVTQLLKLGFTVVVEEGAGRLASFDDASYIAAGATIGTVNPVWKSDIVLKVNPPTEAEVKRMNKEATLISFIQPAQNEALVELFLERKINALAMDRVPRISRAQSMDALSSMANIAGYRAIVEASHEFGRFFTGQITAAGKIPPAKVMVIGAGVAGLSAIGAAGSMGAIVRAFDTRPEVKEQVESMGAEFLELNYQEEAGNSDGYAKEMSKAFIDAEMALFAQQAQEVDIIVTTALIPGKPAPKLITKAMVESMKAGSVIVDLAAQNGGNCELTVANEVVETDNGVRIIGYTDLASRLATQASQLYGTNLVNLLKLLCKENDGTINLDFEDVVIHATTVTKEGEKITPPVIQVSAQPKKEASKVQPIKQEKKPASPWVKYTVMAVGIFLFACIANSAPAEFLSHFTVFTLACIVGYYVVWNVTHALHTPLMSVTNAISGIIVVGAVMQIGQPDSGWLVGLLSFIAILIACINIFGGFYVTQRMLKMFIRK